jgi:hypothetical protein
MVLEAAGAVVGAIADCANAGAATPNANNAASAADLSDVIIQALLMSRTLLILGTGSDYNMLQPTPKKIGPRSDS